MEGIKIKTNHRNLLIDCVFLSIDSFPYTLFHLEGELRSNDVFYFCY
jgi:hypothetical protein